MDNQEEFELFNTSLTYEFYENARAAEILSGTSNASLIKEFHTNITLYAGTRWPTMWLNKKRTRVGLPWTPSDSSELAIAILEGLFNYAKEIIHNSGAPLANLRQVSLLHWTITGPRRPSYYHSWSHHMSTAVLNGCHHFATFLLQNGEDPNGRTPVSFNTEDMDGNCATELIELTPVHYTLGLQVLIEGGSAAWLLLLEMIKILVEGGARVNDTALSTRWLQDSNSMIRKRARDCLPQSMSALHYLLSNSHVRYNLFEDESSGALRAQLVKTFLQNGADPNAVDSNGKSVLECALQCCPYDIVELMLEKGAKITPSLLSESGTPIYEKFHRVRYLRAENTSSHTEKFDPFPAGKILDEMRWRRPECYTDEAREIARPYNPHWAEIKRDASTDISLVKRLSTFLRWG